MQFRGGPCLRTHPLETCSWPGGQAARRSLAHFPSDGVEAAAVRSVAAPARGPDFLTVPAATLSLNKHQARSGTEHQCELTNDRFLIKSGSYQTQP